jgi:hypothetical protein
MRSGFPKLGFWRAIILTALWLAGCAKPVPQLTPIPTPTPVVISLPPALAPLRQAVEACQSALPDLALFVVVQSQAEPDADLSIAYNSDASEANIYQIGWDQLLPVYSDSGQNFSLSLENLKQRYLYTDQAESVVNRDLMAWTYPDGDILRLLFEEVLFGTSRISQEIYIAPDPESMAQALAKMDNPSVGYLPAAWKTDKLKEIRLPPAIKSMLRLPILVKIARPSWPAGQMLIACLQSGVGQDIIRKTYLPISP